MLGWFRALRRSGVLGINARNRDFVMTHNQRRFYPRVDNKVLTKQLVTAHGMAAPALYGVIKTVHDIADLDQILDGNTEFVIKPAAGSGGDGIMIFTGKRGDLYQKASGLFIAEEDLRHHISNILSGMYSLGGQPDMAMVEALVHFDPDLSSLTFRGVPDIRVIVYHGYPTMAMARLPTRMSDGKANLHQGAVGVGIDIATGVTLGGVLGTSWTHEHPDTARTIAGNALPHWPQILDMAARCHEAVELGYLGVDIVLDRDRGPLILELNARPGLNIQIANRCGLRARLDAVSKHRQHVRSASPAQRIAWASAAFAVNVPSTITQAGHQD